MISDLIRIQEKLENRTLILDYENSARKTINQQEQDLRGSPNLGYVDVQIL